MPNPIELTVQEDEAIELSPEELRVVNAVSPEATVEENKEGAEITIRDLLHGETKAQIYNGKQGEEGPQGPKGEDYVLTEQDKTAIASVVTEMIGLNVDGNTLVLEKHTI